MWKLRISIVAKLNVPAFVVTKCEQEFTSEDERLLCQRGAMAGLSTARLFQELRKQPEAPKFDTPDAMVVSTTNHNHPATQCRLDTYFAGAVCGLDDNSDVSQRDEATGVCYRKSGDTTGVRPLCWFAPKK